MNKKIGIIVGVVIAVVLSLFFVFKEDSFTKKIDDLKDTTKAYKLEGNMSIVKGENEKLYAIEVGYKKGEEDFFRVSIHDKELNQTQVILRNKEGVYVLTPALNQIFKFEGDWPLNSLKPYLLQSMYEIVASDSCQVEKAKDSYIATSPVNYPNNSNYKVQKMKFDDKAHIQEVSIYNDENVEQLKIEFTTTNYNAKLKEDYFALPSKMDSAVSAPFIMEDQMPLYPMLSFDSTLRNTRSMQVGNDVKHILEYEGDRNFTIIESVQKQSETLETVIMPGTLVDYMDVFGFYDGNHMQLIKEGIEYTIYSEDLTPEEMVSVLNSMQVTVLK